MGDNNNNNAQKSMNLDSKQIKLPFIDPSEFIVTKTVGYGTFGFVKKATWNQQSSSNNLAENSGQSFDVAIKYMKDFNDFVKEAEQLSIVKHEFIIDVYGYTKNIRDTSDEYGLVLEFADGGNLYNFLHQKINNIFIKYTLSHALSWCLQCAYAVNYLHSKNILHRDLKPSNLLLTNKCRTLKICDFGTAREKQTTMSINLGTPCWMAPEVFRSKKYTEKCDVFSWGIILWEVLSREQPFQNYENNYAILWGIQTGARPPMIENCPLILKKLMVNCWDNDQDKRPSMAKVCRIMEKLLSILTPNESQMEIIIPMSTNDIVGDASVAGRISNIIDIDTNSLNNNNNNTIFSDDCLLIPRHNNLNINKQIQMGHKRSNSSDANLILNVNPQPGPNPAGQLNNDVNLNTGRIGHNYNDNIAGATAANTGQMINPTIYDELSEEEIQELLQNFNAFIFLPQKFMPSPPDLTDAQSMMIFENHRKLALKLYRMNWEKKFWLHKYDELKQKLQNPYLIEDSSKLCIELTREKLTLQKLRSEYAKKLLNLMRKNHNIQRIQPPNNPSNQGQGHGHSNTEWYVDIPSSYGGGDQQYHQP